MERASPKRLARQFMDRFADALAVRVADRLGATEQQRAAEEREGRDNNNLELLIGFLLRLDSNCIDVGANEGRFLWHITQRAPQGRHLAWEPVPSLAARLREVFPAVDVHEAALAERSGSAEFVTVPNDLAYSGLRERTYPGDWATEHVSVAVERLDESLPRDYVPDFIKIDVEGAELGVLQGGLETIARCRPVIAFEHGLGGSDHYGTRPEQVHELLSEHAGLRIFDLDARGPLSRDQFTELFNRGLRWNFLARP